jgi:hypothetical protein
MPSSQAFGDAVKGTKQPRSQYESGYRLRELAFLAGLGGNNLSGHELPARSEKFLAQGCTPYPRLSSCSHCANKHPNSPTCHAFVSGIPAPLLNAEHDHRTAFPGDFGIRYEPDRKAVRELRLVGWL